jgi:hypothetical protein
MVTTATGTTTIILPLIRYTYTGPGATDLFQN